MKLQRSVRLQQKVAQGRWLILFLAIFGMRAPICCAAGAPPRELQSTFTAWTERRPFPGRADSIDFPYTRIVNRRFTVVHLEGSKPDRLVLEETFETEQCLLSDPTRAEITVGAWPLIGPGGTEPIWRIRSKGFGGEVPIESNRQEMYKVLGGGCCRDVSPDVFFNLSTGEELFRSYGPYLRVDLPRAHARRIITFDDHDLSSAPDPGPDGKILGRIEYGERPKAQAVYLISSGTSQFQSKEFYLVSKGEKVPSGHLRIAAVTDPAAMKDVEVVVEFDSIQGDPGSETSYVSGASVRVEIPIGGDRLVVAAAKGPKGIHLIGGND